MTMGALEILLFLFVVFLILGPRRIAGLGRSLGRGVRDFKLEFDRELIRTCPMNNCRIRARLKTRRPPLGLRAPIGQLGFPIANRYSPLRYQLPAKRF
jgi:sec-independent protein translocase protein TatA